MQEAVARRAPRVGNAGPGDGGDGRGAGDRGVDVVVGDLALHHRERGVFDRPAAISARRPAPAAHQRHAAAQRAEGGDEGTGMAASGCPSRRPRRSRVRCRRRAVSAGRAGSNITGARPVRSVQHRDHRRAASALAQQLGLDARAERGVALRRSRRGRRAAEIVLRNQVEEAVRRGGNARLQLRVAEHGMQPGAGFRQPGEHRGRAAACCRETSAAAAAGSSRASMSDALPVMSGHHHRRRLHHARARRHQVGGCRRSAARW